MSDDEDVGDGNLMHAGPFHSEEEAREAAAKIRKFIRELTGDDDENYEILCPIPPDVMKEWEGLEADHRKAVSLMKAAEARRMLFWTNLEARLNIYGREMRINDDDGVIMIKKEHVSKEDVSKGDSSEC